MSKSIPNVTAMVEILKASGGTFTSVHLAEICSVERLNDFHKKMAHVLGGHPDTKANIEEIQGALDGAAGVAASFEKYAGNGKAVNQRTIYILNRDPAILMAMSYSYPLQAIVYQAFEEYRKGMDQISKADTIEAAKQISTADFLSIAVDKIQTLQKESNDKSIRSLSGLQLLKTGSTASVNMLNRWLEKNDYIQAKLDKKGNSSGWLIRDKGLPYLVGTGRDHKVASIRYLETLHEILPKELFD